jgi:hypothetical protein
MPITGVLIGVRTTTGRGNIDERNCGLGGYLRWSDREQNANQYLILVGNTSGKFDHNLGVPIKAVSGLPLRRKSMSVLTRDEKCLNHLRTHEVSTKLVQLVQPEGVSRKI